MSENVFGSTSPMAGAQGAAGSTVAATSYGAFTQPLPGEIALVDVGDGAALQAGQAVYLIRNSGPGAYYYLVEDSEGGDANQAQLRRVAGVRTAVATGQTMPGGSVYITAPLGPATSNWAPARVAATTTNGAVSAFSILLQPSVYGALSINAVDALAETALTASGTGTNYKTYSLTIYDAAGALTATVNMETTTSPVTPGNYALGSIGAKAKVTIDLASTIEIPAGGSAWIGLAATNGNQSTPVMRFEGYLK